METLEPQKDFIQFKKSVSREIVLLYFKNHIQSKQITKFVENYKKLGKRVEKDDIFDWNDGMFKRSRKGKTIAARQMTDSIKTIKDVSKKQKKPDNWKYVEEIYDSNKGFWKNFGDMFIKGLSNADLIREKQKQGDINYLTNIKAWNEVKRIMQIIDPSGILNYPDLQKAIISGNSSDIVVESVGSLPLIGKVRLFFKSVKSIRTGASLYAILATVKNMDDVNDFILEYSQ